MKVLIVGGVAGGASCAARLRRLDEKAEITILERGEYISFANCGLPYYIGGEITDKSRLTLQTPNSLKRRFNIDVRVFCEAVSVNPQAKCVTVREANGNTYTQNYDKLVLSPGAAPILPKMEGINNERVFTLRNIPDTLRTKGFIDVNKPRSAVVVGGGYVGIEMAENLVKAGIDVTVVELSDHLIAPLDFDMAADVHHYVRSKGINLVLSTAVTAIKNREQGLTVQTQKDNIDADMVIMSVGVKPETAFLSGSGIATNARGSIIVDEQMRTSVEDIYAVGDAVEILSFITKQPAFIPLAGPANKQGRIAADNICGISSKYCGTQGSAVVKIFDMTVATTGLNESSAKAAGIDYDKTYTYSASHATYYPGHSMMMIKVLWEKSSLKLIGAQIVGKDGVDKRMDVLASAIRFGAKATDLVNLELTYAPPFGSAKDPVNMIGYVAENVINGIVKQFYWHDVAKLARDGSVTLLDTRMVHEFAAGNIDGFINIPLDELRNRLDEIPKNKPVYVHCFSGHRSYVACRILSAHGYECYNLTGGWRLYESVISELQK